MGITQQSTGLTPPLPALRALAGACGVHPTDADLEAVRGFLDAILPALAELERELPPSLPPAGLFLPGQPVRGGQGRA
jgi:hypothetical protein